MTSEHANFLSSSRTIKGPSKSQSVPPLKKRRRSYDDLLDKFQTPGVRADTVDMTRESSVDDNAGVDEVNRTFDEINDL